MARRHSDYLYLFAFGKIWGRELARMTLKVEVNDMYVLRPFNQVVQSNISRLAVWLKYLSVMI